MLTIADIFSGFRFQVSDMWHKAFGSKFEITGMFATASNCPLRAQRG
jgi:hypothetical protein